MLFIKNRADFPFICRKQFITDKVNQYPPICTIPFGITVAFINKDMQYFRKDSNMLPIIIAIILFQTNIFAGFRLWHKITPLH